MVRMVYRVLSLSYFLQFPLSISLLLAFLFMPRKARKKEP